MDELVNNLTTNFNVSGDNFSSNAAAGHPHFTNYKNRGMAAEKQAKRRQEFLDIQKTKRAAALALVRHLDADGVEDEDEEEDESTGIDERAHESMEDGASSVKSKPYRRRSNRETNPFQDQLMCSEWLVHVPEQMADEWMMVPCPEGKRVLVVATQGWTKAYAKNGRQFKEFSSTLPGGFSDKESWKTKSTILDCVFCYEKSTFYCLDIISWNGCPVYDSDTEFRFFWLQSKLAEEPSLSEASALNRFAFKALERCVCTKKEMERVMAEKLPYKLDGLLFYYKGARYMAGQTPLVGWLKPFMMHELLGVEVPTEYTSGYEATGSKGFIDEFNSEYESKHGGRQYGGKKGTTAMETPAATEETNLTTKE